MVWAMARQNDPREISYAVRTHAALIVTVWWLDSA